MHSQIRGGVIVLLSSSYSLAPTRLLCNFCVESLEFVLEEWFLLHKNLGQKHIQMHSAALCSPLRWTSAAGMWLYSRRAELMAHLIHCSSDTLIYAECRLVDRTLDVVSIRHATSRALTTRAVSQYMTESDTARTDAEIMRDYLLLYVNVYFWNSLA